MSPKNLALSIVLFVALSVLLCSHGNKEGSCSQCKSEKEDAERKRENAGNANRENGHKKDQKPNGGPLKK